MRIRYVLATLLGLFALLTLFDRFVLVEMLIRRTALPLVVALAVAIACVGVGAVARRSEDADAALDFLIGYPLFGAVCFLVGTVNVSVWTMVPVVAIGAVVGGLRIRAGWKPAERPAGSRRSASASAWAFAVAVVIACGFVWAQAPPSSLDELSYHLAVPQAWVLEGRAVELPLSSHSYFPLGIESADLAGLALLGAGGGGVASHFLHLFAAIATCLLIARRTESWLATAAIVTTPALAITAGWSLVDWPLAGLFVVTFVALERDDTRTASAATAAGLLTKYTFLPFAILAWAIKRKRPHAIVLAGLVFFARNAILTFNPFAPFFGADAPHVSGYRALALADYVFEGSFIDEAIGASIVALPAFAMGALALGSVAIALALFFLAPSSRILVPYLVVPSLTAAESLKKKWFAVLIGICVVVQTFLVVWFTARGGAFSLLAGGMSEEEYLRKQRPVYASIEWLNTQLPESSRTLIVGTNETYWFARPVRGGGNFDGPRVSRYLESLALREQLRSDGITHVAVIAATVPTSNEQKIAERQTTLSPAAQRNLVAMLNRLAGSVTSRGDVTLFQLR
ncbi:MAG: hypothetical protein ACXW5U_17960 [Thermoanaerobaculia bacterium]